MELKVGDRVSWNHDPLLKGTVVATHVVRVVWDQDPDVDFDYPVHELQREVV